MELYQHQIEALDFLQQNGSGILAMEMGLGKSPVAIKKSVEWGGVVVIACPAFLVSNWVNEWHKWTGLYPYRVIEKGMISNGNTKVLVGSYSMLMKRYMMGRLKPEQVTTLICDESVYIKNYRSKRTKFILKFKNVKHRILLSGTPMLNRPIELLPQLQMINNGIWGNYFAFVNTYCIQWNGWLIKDRGKNLDKLAERVKHYIFRKKSEDVLDMPAIVRKDNIIDLYAQNEEEIKQIRVLRDQEDRSEALRRLMEYRRHLEMFKAKWFVKNFEKDYFEDKKILVGVQFRDTAKYLARELKGLEITGAIEATKRVGLIQDKFKTNDQIFCFATIPSVAEGLNLEWIDEVYILGLGWTPATHQQFEARLRRITRKEKVVSTYFICPKTVDEFIIKKLKNKQSMIDQVIDGKTMKIQQQSAQMEYLNSL